MQGRGQSIYLFNFNLQIWLWCCQLGHASNTKIVQVSRLIDGIDFGKITIEPIDKSDFSNSIPESDLDVDKLAPIPNIIELNIDSVEKLWEASIKSKHIKIVKSKRMTLTMRRLQEIYTNLWSQHKPAYILDKNYIVLLLNKFTRKS